MACRVLVVSGGTFFFTVVTYHRRGLWQPRFWEHTIEDVEELRESTVSLMPEKLLDELTDRQIRDLMAYLQSDGPSKK